MKNKFLPEYLQEYSEGFKDVCTKMDDAAEGFKAVCKKLDMILDAIYGEEADKEIAKEQAEADADKEVEIVIENADDKPTTTAKKRGRKPKE